MAKTFDYQRKKCVVTGAASGMGLSVARMLNDLGAEVYGLDIKDMPVSAKNHVRVDMGIRDSIDAAATRLPAKIDSIFCCAGIAGTIYAGKTFDPVDVVRINFVGPQYFIESLIPRMGSGGSIAMIASIGGMGWVANLAVSVLPFLAVEGFEEKVRWLEANRTNAKAIGGIPEMNRPYCFSKECLIVYAKKKAWELAGKNIRINTLSPGSTATPMLDDFNRIGKTADGATKGSVSPIGVPSTPEDQARAMIYLNSDYANYVSGVDLQVDYGFSGGVFTGMKRFDHAG